MKVLLYSLLYHKAKEGFWVYSVLIVDDIDVMRLQLRRLKVWGKKTGFEIVDEAKNGYDALLKLQASPVDLVITDIKMPEIDGIELTRLIIQQRLAHCVVLLSDYTDFNHARQGFLNGAFDFIGRAVDEDEVHQLLMRVSEYLTNLRNFQEQFKRLESIVEEHIQNLHPANHIIKIVEYIEAGSSVAIEVVENMVQSVSTSLDHDFTRARQIITKAISEIVEAVLNKNSWISLFRDVASLKNVDFSKCQDEEVLIEKAKAVIEILMRFMTQFLLRGVTYPLVRQVCQYTLQNFNHELSVNSIAKGLYISQNYLSVLFKEKTGLILTDYLTMIKIERAKKLILDNQLKNYEVAQQVGYKDNEYFSKLFKKYEGLSPTEFRLSKSK